MDACRICTLIFDAKPLEIARSSTDPTICLICEEKYMDAQTRERTIKVHTLVITDPEIEAALTNPDPLIDFLRDLLIAKPIANGHAQTSKGHAKKQRTSGKVNCQYCARLISTRQIGRHENKCPQRPVAAPQE